MSRRRRLLLLLLLLLLVVNLVAALHARALLTYAPAGTRTPPPEQLSVGDKLLLLLTGVTVPRPGNTRTPDLPFTTHLVPVGDGHLELWEISAGEAADVVLLFPGYGGSKESLLGEATALHEMGFTAVLVDFRGAGGSSGSRNTVGVEEAEDAAAASVFFSGRRRIVYGASMGAVAVLRAVEQGWMAPDLLILESPFDRLTSTVGNRFASMGLPDFPFAQLLVFWGSVQGGFNGFAHNPVEYARSVKCPTLLLYGDQDARVTVAQSEEILAALGETAEAEAAAFSCGHGMLFSSSPERWRARVGAFLLALEQRDVAP